MAVWVEHEETVPMGSRPIAGPRGLVSRFAAILGTFRAGDRHSVTEIARMTGLPVSTTYRLVTDMAAWQILQRTPEGDYTVGFALQTLTSDVSDLPTLEELAPHVLTDLCSATCRRARLGILVDERVAYAEKRPGAEPVAGFCPSATLPAHATALGKALLAFAPLSAVASVARRMTAFTSRTIVSPDRLRSALSTVRLSQVAVACGELVDGDLTVAVPVFAGGGGALAAMELQVHDLRDDLRVCSATLTVAARGLSRDLVGDAHRPVRPRLCLSREKPVQAVGAPVRAGVASGN